MDPISHATSGALLALSLPQRPSAKYFVPLSALIAASPDIDVFFSPNPIDFLLLHRGITHSIFAIPVMAPLFALLLFVCLKKTYAQSWSYLKACVFASLLLLLHIWLDIITTYGTMIFLPFSDYRVRLNGIFIIDLLLLIPMLLSLFYGFKRRKIAVYCLIWMFIYPSACVALRMWHETQATERLSEAKLTNIAVFPDAFAPFYWRIVYETNTPFIPEQKDIASLMYIPENDKNFLFPSTPKSVHHQGINIFGTPHSTILNYPALEEHFAISLAENSRRAKAYLDFSLMPIAAISKTDYSEEFIISDLRFSTMLPFVQSIMMLRNNGAPPFLFMAKLEHDKWSSVRLFFSGSGKDSSWQKPTPPSPPTWWQFLVGTY